MTMSSCSSPRADRRLIVALLLWILQPRDARAEDAVSYKYQDYRESGGRIAVQVQSALIEKDVGEAGHVKLMGIVDAITGATPTGQPERTAGAGVPLATIDERRKAWSLDVSKQFGIYKVALGAANSRESDYVSHGWSVNASAELNQKNTTLALGVAGLGDDVKVFYRRPWERKVSFDIIAGVNQVIDERTAITCNLTFGRARGYLSDPYKLVQKEVEVLPGVLLPRTYPENRPDVRHKWLALFGVNRAYPEIGGALDASYRFHHDDFGISSHTLDLQWYQKLGERWVIGPAVRWYTQDAADFYHVSLDGTGIAPTAIPTGQGPHYSSDYRLSSLQTVNYGIKAVWNITPAWQLDAALEKYRMRGRDGKTSASAYPRAVIFTTGLRLAF